MKIKLLALFLTLNSSLIFGQSGNALYFDNVDDVITVPNASALIANSNTISMSFWVYPQNTTSIYPDLDGFAGFRNNTDADFYLVQLNSTDVEPRFRNSAGTNFDFVYTGLQLNVWQHFVMTYDGTSLKIYQNSVLGGSIPANGVISLMNDPFYIGQTPWTSAGFFLNGKIDEVSLWNKTLSQSEIDCIYNGAIDPSSTDLKLYYRFNQGVANGNNAGVNSLDNAASATMNGVMTGFALNGTTSNWVPGISTANSSVVNDVICPGVSYIFGSQTITAPGSYYEAYPIAGGCDSIAELNLSTVAFNTTISQFGTVLTSMQTGAAYQWINCGTGNSLIPGATSQSYTATVNGQYAVILTLGGCSDTTNCVNITNVGLNDLESTSMSASPNPFNTDFTLTLPENFIGKKVTVYDVTGREIYNAFSNGRNMTIETSGWSNTIYYVAIEGISSRIKLVKQ